jgi:3-deoxy-D-manno-octulosonate 8-phosphate phosphatase (KDO 8-P phosphatase)
VARRAAELRVPQVRQGVGNKGEAVRSLAAELGLRADELAYVGDDLNDLLAFEAAGLRIAVADAAAELRAAANWVTTRPGGSGAVREVVEAVLRAQGRWEEAVRCFVEALARPTEANDPLPVPPGEQ